MRGYSPSFATLVPRVPEQPGVGRPGRVRGTRELIVFKTRYIVPCRVQSQTIEILRVFSRLLP